MEARQILNWLEEMYPDKMPLTELTPYELGVLVGQRLLIEQLKIKLQIEELVQDEIK